MKFILGFLFMGLTISCISINFGYFKFKKSVQKSYNDNGYQLAEVVRKIVSDEEIAEYSKYIRWDIDKEKCKEAASDKRYLEIEKELSDLREATGANDIYIGYLRTDILKEYAGTKEGWYPLRYIFDVYEVPELKYTLGDASPINPEFIDDCTEFMETGVRPSNFFVSKSEYGYNTAAILPIVKEGEVVAIIGVEIPMSTQEAVIREHVTDTLLIIGIMIIILMIVYIVWFMGRVVWPIEALSKEAETFTLETHSEGHTGYTISDKLLKVRTGDEIEYLAKSLYNMEKYIDATTRDLISAARESERERSELGIANKIQKDILPSHFPAFPERHEFDIYASMTPARLVAGDFYDYFFIDENRLCLVIADVTGKGIPAALFMVIAKTVIKNRAMLGGMPSEILKDVNNQLREGNDTKMFVTAWLGITDVKTGVLTFANAGHEYPVLTAEDGTFKYLKDKHGLVMGLKADISYTDTQVMLRPGDTLFVYTDGVPDAQDYEGDAYGIDRLINVMNEYRGVTPQELIERVLDSVMEYSKDVDQFDDVTMLAFTYLGLQDKGYGEDTGGDTAKIELEARLENTRKAVGFVGEILINGGLETKAAGKISLAVEELFVNIANYAYPDGDGMACIRVGYPDDSTLRIELIDDGIPYDPSSKEDPDITVPLKKRGIGGMGIFMAKNIMDEMKYERRDGQNHLTLIKKLKGGNEVG
jgi:sigma-B regulation protein RsbU (phosphoserine phosphatase)